MLEHDESFNRPIRPWVIVTNQVEAYEQAKKNGGFMKEKAKICLNVKWSPPHDGWVCLNTDGAASQSKCRAGCGGVVRCQDGQ